MTLDDAIEQIQQAGECFVIWNQESGEIVEVCPLPAGADAIQSAGALTAMRRHAFPSKGRFFSDGSAVTRADLERATPDGQRIRLRRATRHYWRRLAGVDELLDILEGGAAPAGFEREEAVRVITGCLSRYHDRGLSPESLGRVEALVADARLPDEVRLQLRILLCTNRGDGEALARIWFSAGKPLHVYEEVFRAFGDLGVALPEVISELIATVRSRAPFGLIRAAALALGKLGPAAGEAAARAVEEAIYDSAPEVASMRRRIAAHIRSRTHWTECPDCDRGLVIVENRDLECSRCSGLGLDPRSE